MLECALGELSREPFKIKRKKSSRNETLLTRNRCTDVALLPRIPHTRLAGETKVIHGGVPIALFYPDAAELSKGVITALSDPAAASSLPALAKAVQYLLRGPVP
jgi:hypothetical protein